MRFIRIASFYSPKCAASSFFWRSTLAENLFECEANGKGLSPFEPDSCLLLGKSQFQQELLNV
jgi:hypothetical protein